MKRVIRCSNGAGFETLHDTVTHGNNGKYAVRGEYDPANGRIWATVTKLAAYDDAEYVWAKIGGNGLIQFIKDGKVIDKMQTHSFEYEDYESVEEYVDDIIDTAIVELINFNKTIKPRMMYD